MPAYYGVYRVRKNGALAYVSRTCTANQKLAEEIAADFSRGEYVRPDGSIGYMHAAPHITREIKTQA